MALYDLTGFITKAELALLHVDGFYRDVFMFTLVVPQGHQEINAAIEIEPEERVHDDGDTCRQAIGRLVHVTGQSESVTFDVVQSKFEDKQQLLANGTKVIEDYPILFARTFEEGQL